MKYSDGGKGSKRRKENSLLFEQNYDKIFGNKNEKVKDEAYEISNKPKSTDPNGS